MRDTPTSFARDPWLLVLLGIGLLIRVVATVLTDGAIELQGDDKVYVTGVVHWMDRGELDTGVFVRPPLYFVLLAGIRLVSVPLDLPWLLVTKLLQCVAGAATALPVYASARRLAGVRAARLAAGFLLLDPTLIAYTHLLWPETVFALVVAIIFDGIARLDSDRPTRALALGALAGAAMLLKPAFGLFTLVLAASWLIRLGPAKALRLALLFGSSAALVISPWVVRNQLRYGPAIVLENQGSYNLWIGNDPRPPDQIYVDWIRLSDPVTRSRTGLAQGVRAIAAEPSAFVTKSPVRALNLWGFEYFVVRNLTLGGYGPVEKGTFLFWFWVLQAGYTFALLTAAAGIPTLVRKPQFRTLFAYAAVLTLVTAAMVTTTRFRVPFGFVLAIASGVGLSRLLARRIARNEVIAMGLAALLLLASATRPVFQKIGAGDFDHPAELRHPAWLWFRY